MTEENVATLSAKTGIPEEELNTRAAAIRGAARAFKASRTSAVINDSPMSTSPSGQINSLFQSYAPLGYMLPWEVLDYVELLAIYNPDYSQAVENISTLANSGHELFVDASSDRAKKRIKAMLEEKARTIQEYHGGIDGIIDKMLKQASTYGTMCGEWVVNEDLTDIVDFVDINPKVIRFFWEDDEQKWAPYQKVKHFQVEEAKKRGQKVRGTCIKLNEVTFRYYAFDPAPQSPYGTPPFIASLANIAIQRDMIHNMSQIVKKVGLLGIIDLVIEQLPMKPGESEEAYEARAGSYLDQYAEIVEEMVREGGIVHFDDVEVSTTNISGNAAGATNIFKQNEELVFSGLKSMPSMQGRCVVPETKVLTAELEWVEAGSLCLGDELIGFGEEIGGKNASRSALRFENSHVECNDRIELPCVRIVTDQGEITVSTEHPLVAYRNGKFPNQRQWRNAEDIKPGDKLAWFGEPWEEERSYEAGWLAGFLDGEGSIKFNKAGYVGEVGFTQLPGPVLEETQRVLKKLGFNCPSGMRDSGVTSNYIVGGRYETMRILGAVRPIRLLAKAVNSWFKLPELGVAPNITSKHNRATVVSVENVGVKEVVALQTSSRTFLGGGFYNHNSYSTTETYAGVAYDIIIRNTRKYQRGAKRMIESGYWLMATLKGETPDSIHLKFNDNKTLHRLHTSQAEQMEIRNSLLLWELGIIDQLEVAQRHGYSSVDRDLDLPPGHEPDEEVPQQPNTEVEPDRDREDRNTKLNGLVSDPWLSVGEDRSQNGNGSGREEAEAGHGAQAEARSGAGGAGSEAEA